MDLDNEDIIIALATPAGNGAIAVIRMSGEGSIGLIEKCVNEKLIKKVTFCNFYKGKDIIDDVLVTTFKKGYTNQESVEISCHNSSYIIQNILTTLIDHGSRLATNGEFTRRAFLNGRFDLSQSEAVADLIASDSKYSHDIALQQMKGAFSTEIKGMRQKLIEIASLLELEIDFSQEDIELIKHEDVLKKMNDMTECLTKLIQSFEIGEVIKNGLAVAIIGKPNVGKSSLLNIFLKEDRAIVSSIAGTTRDTIEGEVILGGIKCRFIDTAGLRNDIEDEVEKMGIQRTYNAIQNAKLIIYMIDVNSKKENYEEDLQLIKDKPHILVVNKVDLKDVQIDKEWIHISTYEKRNIDEIEKMITKMFERNDYPTIISNARHYNELKLVKKYLNEAMTSIDNDMPNDIIMVDVNLALTHLGYITGEITNNNILDSIFKNFCIGK